MITRRDTLFTIISDQDLHDHTFEAAHYHGNDHLDLTIPLDRHDRRSLHLGANQCRHWGLKLLELAERMPLTNPKLPLDFQI